MPKGSVPDPKRPAVSVFGNVKNLVHCGRLTHSPVRSVAFTAVFCASRGLFLQSDAITLLVCPALPLAVAALPRVAQTSVLCTVP